MTRTYGKLLSSLWVSSKKWRALGRDDKAKLLYCYLQTCPHGNNVGCFVLPCGYVMADLGWSQDEITQALDSLRTACLIEWNEGESVVRIVDAIEKDPPTNPSHAAAMFKSILALPDCQEKLRCLTELASVRQASKIDGLQDALNTLGTACEQGARPYLTLPTPNPTLPSPSSLRSEESDAVAPPAAYAFKARVIRLKPEDFERWCTGFAKGNRDRLVAWLQQRDDWLADQDAEARKRWFLSTSNWLARKAKEPEIDVFEMPVYLRRGAKPDEKFRDALTRLQRGERWLSTAYGPLPGSPGADPEAERVAAEILGDGWAEQAERMDRLARAS